MKTPAASSKESILLKPKEVKWEMHYYQIYKMSVLDQQKTSTG
jgi:hypothetical protein